MAHIEMFGAVTHDDFDKFIELQGNDISIDEPLDIADDFLDTILQNGAPLVAIATFYGAEKCLQWMLNAIDPLHIQDLKGVKLIHFGASSKNFQVFQMILDLGFALDTKDNYERQPIHFAAKYGNLSVLQQCWMDGQDLQATDAFGYTPLHYAVQFGQPEIINFLGSNGVELNPLDVLF